ncbi:MAG: M28 family peptidase, partial [Bacteroidales bacterium]|nr:M28 family peptidase [Bacteroidales bacterium]
IILFDLEDYGVPNFEDYSDNLSWALGSQYWAKNPHQPDYTANFGILLDMVGAKDVVFKMEYYSMYYAPHIVKKVWKQAGILGYDSTFIFEDGGMVMDDHIPVNEILKIPMIDIIHYDPATESMFFPHWHTMKDNLDAIDKTSLQIVGETVTHVVYYE